MRKLISAVLIVSLAFAFITFSGPVSLAESYVKPVSSYPNNGNYPYFSKRISFNGKLQYHLGIDLPAPVGTPVYAILDGTVVMSDEYSYYGSLGGARGGAIVIKHTDNNGKTFYALYGHINRTDAGGSTVMAGQTVTKGQQIGTVRSYDGGNHLHFGINTSAASVAGYNETSLGSWVDPVQYINANCSGSSNPGNPPQQTGNYTFQYYNNDLLQGNVVYTEYSNDINKSWGNGSPGNGVNSDFFSARITGNAAFEQGYYVFHYEADDSIKVILDDSNTIIDNGGPNASGNQGVNISAGSHKLTVQYSERTGDARLLVNWAKSAPPAPSPSPVPTPAPAPSPTPQPTVVTNYQVFVPGNTFSYDIWFIPEQSGPYSFNVDVRGWTLHDSANNTIDDINWNLRPVLTEGQKYFLRIYGAGYDRTYNVTFSPQVLISSVPVPAAPTGLSSAGKTESSVSISWNYSQYATGYYVYQNGTRVTNSPIASTSYTFSGLSASSEYQVSVSAVNESGESGRSSILSITTDKLLSAPEAPSGFTASSITDTAVDLSWNPVNGATGYYLYIGGYKLTGYPVTSTYYTVNYLSPDDSYDFAVTAVNDAGESLPAVLSVTTLPRHLPGGPAALYFFAISDTTATIGWSSTEGATGYNVYLDGIRLNAFPITSNEYLVTGLSQSTTYSFYVTCVNGFDESPPTYTLDVTTLASQPEKLTPFVDVPMGYMHEKAIQWAYENNISIGNGSLYGPEDNLTEAQFAVMLVKYGGVPYDAFYGGSHFADKFYLALQQKGLPLQGLQDPAIKDMPINRGRIAQIIAAVFGLDYSVEEAILFMYYNNFSSGTSATVRTIDTYGKDLPFIRAAAASFLQKMSQVTEVIDLNGNHIGVNPREIIGIAY